METKICRACGDEMPLTKEYFYSNGYTPNGTRKWKPTCKSCEKAERIDGHEELIKEVFPVLECSICGYNKCKQALDFLKELAEEKGESFNKYAQILITDIEMPQMDGLTLTRKIKEDVLLNKLPVVIFSSLITDELRHKGESVGANAQLSKPEISELVDTIDRLLSI